MNKINLIGNFLGIDGYSRHLRGLANGLQEVGLDVRIDAPLTAQWERYVSDAEYNMLTKKFDPERISIMIGQPQYWLLALAEKPKHFWGFLVWEGDKIPTYWQQYIEDPRVEKILVPSAHTANAIHNSYYCTKPIIIIPHGFNTAKLFPSPEPTTERPFTFIANKGWAAGMNDRGGIQFLLKAFDEEFTKKDNVLLKVKINPSYNVPGWDLKK